MKPKERSCALSKSTIAKLAALAGLLVVIILLYQSLDLATIQSYVAYYREHRAVGLPLFLCLNTVLVMLFCPGEGCYPCDGVASYHCFHTSNHLPHAMQEHIHPARWRGACLALRPFTQAHARGMLHQCSATL